MKCKPFYFAIPLATLVLLAGCVTGTQREGRVIDPGDVARIAVGETTRQEILERFGPPTNFAAATPMLAARAASTALRFPGCMGGLPVGGVGSRGSEPGAGRRELCVAGGLHTPASLRI